MYYNEENRELWKNVIQRVAEESGKNEKMIYRILLIQECLIASKMKKNQNQNPCLYRQGYFFFSSR